MWNQAERGQFRAFRLRAAAILVLTNSVRDDAVKSHAACPYSYTAAAPRVYTRYRYAQTRHALYATATACLTVRSTDSASDAKDGLIGDATRAFRW